MGRAAKQELMARVYFVLTGSSELFSSSLQRIHNLFRTPSTYLILLFCFSPCNCTPNKVAHYVWLKPISDVFKDIKALVGSRFTVKLLITLTATSCFFLSCHRSHVVSFVLRQANENEPFRGLSPPNGGPQWTATMATTNQPSISASDEWGGNSKSYHFCGWHT